MFDSLRPYGLWPVRLLCPWDSSGKNTGVGLLFPSLGNLPYPGIEPASLCLLSWQAAGFFTTSTTWEALGGIKSHRREGEYCEMVQLA